MQKAAAGCERTVAVLSPAYLSSRFAQSEWAAAFANDPKGDSGSLVPVMVEKCSPLGLLKSIVHINLTDTEEENARRLLVQGVGTGRRKPSARPSFPGTAPRPHPSFPADQSAIPPSMPTHIPRIRKGVTDVDKRRFIRHAFETIAGRFEKSLGELSAAEQTVDCDFERRSTTEFAAEIFLHGKSVCHCRLWQGGFLEGISYAEGRTSGDAVNEVLGISDRADELALASLMGISFHRWDEGVDPKRLSEDQAFQYLWRRFVAPLER
jgi:hypothetical protein